MTSIIVSLLVMVVGYAIIFFSWKSTSSNTRKSFKYLYKTIGWGCIFAALLVLVWQVGAEFGMVYGFSGMSLISIALVILNHQKRSSTSNTRSDYQPTIIALSRIPVNILHFIMVFLIIGVFALLSSMQLSQLVNWPPVNQLALAVILLPIIWATTSYLYLFYERRGFATILITASIALIATTLFLTRWGLAFYVTF